VDDRSETAGDRPGRFTLHALMREKLAAARGQHDAEHADVPLFGAGLVRPAFIAYGS